MSGKHERLLSLTYTNLIRIYKVYKQIYTYNDVNFLEEKKEKIKIINK